MAAPVLLVHDDLQVIAALRRMLAREGYEVVLATSAADAVIAFGHHLPGLILLAPSVESGRGHVVLEELKNHPDGQLAKVLLLGESIPGFGYPVAPMPPDDSLAEQVNLLINPQADDWTVTEPEKLPQPPPEPEPGEPPPPMPSVETAGWRTSPPPEDELQPEEPAPPADPIEEASAPPHLSAAEERRDLEGTLFGDLATLEEQAHSAIEAEAMASVDSRLASMPVDPELERLENEVRAEAQRRRRQREAAQPPAPPSIPAVAEQSGAFELSEDDAPAAPPEEPAAPSHQSLDEVEKRRDEAAQREAELEAVVREADERAERARNEWSAREAAALEAVETAEKALKTARNETDVQQRSQRSELERLEREAEHADALVRKERELRAALEEEKEEAAAELERLKRQAFEAEARLKELDLALVKAQGAHEEVRTELALLSEEHQAAVAKLDDEAKKSREHSETAAALEMKVLELEDAVQRATADALAAREQLSRELEHERGQRATLEAHQSELLGDIEKLEQQVQDARAQLEVEREAASQQLKDAHLKLELARDEQATEAQRAAAAETAAKRAEAHVRELEDRAILPLAPAGKPALGVPRTGTVKLGELARLIATLVMGGAECRVELGVTGGTRNLFLRRGQLIAAESSLPYETLSDRARRDGLIDARQEADLSSVRGASGPELLTVMKARGMVRDAEVAGLVQRYTEAVALDAFTESSCTYRLHDEAPGHEVLAATSTRAVLPMVAEALRRVLPPETQLEALGGSEAVPLNTESELETRSLGFTDRERRMLAYVDGEATVEDVVLASGMRPDKAYKVLAVARHLGLIEVRAPAARTAQPSPELDVQRLDAKFEQVQEADYFSILGLSKNAGTDEVQRAWERLSEEFDPIRFSTHPDPSLQQRATVVHRLLEEAAKALEDDRRRADYARHLLD